MFRFSLESLLRLRRSLEKVEEERLLQANQQVRRQRDRIAHLDDWSRAQRDRRDAGLKAGEAAIELHFELACHEQLGLLRKELERQLTTLLESCAQQQKKYASARRNREVLEQLRSRQFERYRVEEVRREQRRTDEQFLLRSRYLHRGG